MFMLPKYCWHCDFFQRTAQKYLAGSGTVPVSDRWARQEVQADREEMTSHDDDARVQMAALGEAGCGNQAGSIPLSCKFDGAA